MTEIKLKQVIEDKLKICSAHKVFSDAMLARMLAKYDEGKRGWDDNSPENRAIIYRKLTHEFFESNFTIKENRYLDVANWAMMLWLFDRGGK